MAINPRDVGNLQSFITEHLRKHSGSPDITGRQLEGIMTDLASRILRDRAAGDRTVNQTGPGMSTDAREVDQLQRVINDHMRKFRGDRPLTVPIGDILNALARRILEFQRGADA